MIKKFKISILGTGNIAKNFHIPAWLKNNNCNIVGLCDKNKKKLVQVKNFFKVKKYFTNYLLMLKKIDFDIINICTPPYLHFKNIILSIKFNKNILVEKPFVTSLKDLLIIKNKIKNKKILIKCAYHQRYRPISLKIKDTIAKGHIGKVYYINIIHRKFRSIPVQSNYFSLKKYSGGGPLIDLGTHYFDLIAWIFNFPMIRNISCKCSSYIFKKNKKYLPFKKFNNEELAVGQINFKNKILLNFEFSYALNTAHEEIKIEIYGEKGCIIWPYKNYWILRKNKMVKKKFKFKNNKASIEQINDFMKKIKNVDKIKENNKTLYEIEYIVKLIDKLYYSSKTNKQINYE